ncbi:uncharacterized protein LOC135962771 [Calliphora vicina]|uniref:uncharacterized protein LOC135962771 n=1 Tax=Calliphora vicina TaxID=7373 RepID=UPI00325C1D17
MEKIGTRISMLETELKFAWGALDLLTTEYSKIWSRLEKLENIMVEQQSVVNNLMGLINIKGREQQQLEIDNENELLVNDIFLSVNLQPQCQVETALNEGIDLCIKGKFENLYDELNKHDTTSKRIESELDTLGELFNEQQHQQQCSVEDLQYASLEKSKSPSLVYGLDEGQHNSRRYGSRGSMNATLSPPLQTLSSTTDSAAQQKILSNFEGLYCDQQQDNQLFLDQLATNNRGKSTSRLPTTYNILSGENVGVYGALQSASTTSELDSLTGHTNFFRETASKTGPDVIHIQPDDTGGGRARKSEMNEDFYKQLNEMYRENNLAAEFNHNLDKLLHQTEQQNEQIMMGMSNPSTRTNSALDMIHEDIEEEQNYEKQHKPVKNLDESKLEIFVSSTIDNQSAKLQTTDASASASPATNSSSSVLLKHNKESKKHKKKKHHHKDEMEMINNLKSALAQKHPNTELTHLTSHSQSHSVKSSNETQCSTTTSSSSDEHFYDGLDKLDSITKILLLEINKIVDFPTPAREEINELRQLVKMEKLFLEKLNQVNQNLILLLLNPVTMAEELRSIESKEWFKMVMRKLEKNIDTLKKLVGNSFDNYKTQMEAASSLCRLTAAPLEPLSSNKTAIAIHDTGNTAQPEVTDYSVQLIRHNSNLDEQLKLLDSQEKEMHKKKKIQQEQQNCTNYMRLSNYVDVDASYENLLMQQIIDPNSNMFPSSSLSDTSITSLSSKNIYSNDAYIKSLKRSLERHNSMLFLLHLQNPDYKDKMPELAGLVEDDLILSDSGNHSPPPPAPDIDMATLHNMDHASNDVMLFLANKDNISPMNHFLLLESSKKVGHDSALPCSPKQPKSDSGLSSMSGLSTWDKSPNSPVSFNNTDNNPFLTKYQDINMEMLQLLTMKSQRLPSNVELSQFGIEEEQQQKDYVFSEENLNYIRELSKNMPICSAFENKSMFSIFQNNILEQQNSTHTVDEMLAWDQQQQQIEKRRMPDLLKTQVSASALAQTCEDYQHTSKTSNRSNTQLTDRLVYYPTSSSLIDYNSSRRLDHPHTNNKHAKFHEDVREPSSVLVASVASEDSSSETYATRRDHGKHQPKVWQRLGNLLNDNFKLKRPTRYNRSQSLPTGDMATHRSKVHMRGQAGSYPSVVTTTRKNTSAIPYQQDSGPDSRPKSVQYLSTSSSMGGKHRKKASFSTTMNNFMQKAKTYRRYSCGLRHGSSLSDPEADLASFTSSDNDESIASDYGGVALNNDFEMHDKDRFMLPSEMQRLDLQFLHESHKPAEPKKTEPHRIDEKIHQNFHEEFTNINKSFNDQTDLEIDDDLGDECNNRPMSSIFPIVGDRATQKAKLSNASPSDDVQTSPSIQNLQELANETRLNEDNAVETVTGTRSNQRQLKKIDSLCLNDNERPQLFPTISPNILLITTTNITTTSTTDPASLVKNSFANSRVVATSTQQSLEIPSLTASSKEDEDNRSQYSYRTLSSSRRQSTEDSIDTDDEYFCYELRQLDELEKQQKQEQQQLEDQQQRQEEAEENQQLFNQIDQLTAHNHREDDIDEYEPDEKIRAQMSEVLQELKHKVKLQPEMTQTYRRTSKSRIITDRYTKVSDMHKAWQDINGDETAQDIYTTTELEIEIKNKGQPGTLDDNEIEHLEQEKRQQHRIQNQELEKPPPQKRYKKRRNMRRSNIAIDNSSNDLDNAEAQTHSTSSSLSSEDEAKRQHFKDTKALKPTQIRRNSHERPKPLISTTLTTKQQVIYPPDSSSTDKEEIKLIEMEQMDTEGENGKPNDCSMSSGATSGPDSPTELSGLDNDMRIDDNEDDKIFFKTVPNYQLFKKNQQLMTNKCSSTNGPLKSKDDTPTPTTTPPATESNANQIFYNQDEAYDGHDTDIDDHDNNIYSTMETTNKTQAQSDLTESAELYEQQQHFDNRSSIPTTPTEQTTPETKSFPKLISQDSSIDISQTNGSILGSSKWKLLKTLKERKLEERNNQEKIKEDELNKQREKGP